MQVVHHSSSTRGTVLSLQTSPSLTRNMNVKVASRAVLYIFQNIEIKILVTSIYVHTYTGIHYIKFFTDCILGYGEVIKYHLYSSYSG